jgi:hypothetical protein
MQQQQNQQQIVPTTISTYPYVEQQQPTVYAYPYVPPQPQQQQYQVTHNYGWNGPPGPAYNANNNNIMIVQPIPINKQDEFNTLIDLGFDVELAEAALTVYETAKQVNEAVEFQIKPRDNPLLINQQKIKETPMEREIRIVAQQALKSVEQLANTSTESRDCGEYVYGWLNTLLLMPTYYFFYFLSMLFYPLDKLTNIPISMYVKHTPHSWMDHFCVGICHPWLYFITRRRLKHIGKRAAKLCTTKATHIHLIPVELLLSKKWTSFPIHEQVKSQLVVKEIKQMREYGVGRAETLFVSHRWVRGKPDGPENRVLEFVIEHLKQKELQTLIKYVFFDYTCVPQAPEAADIRINTLLAIPSIMVKSHVFPFYYSDQLREPYMCSVWCQLEAIGFTTVNPIWLETRNWTIYDKEDLFAVIPAFIEMCGSGRYGLFLVAVGERAKILREILHIFIKYCEETRSIT